MDGLDNIDQTVTGSVSYVMSVKFLLTQTEGGGRCGRWLTKYCFFPKTRLIISAMDRVVFP